MDFWERASGAADVFEPLRLELDSVDSYDGFEASLTDTYLSYSGKPEGEEGIMHFTLYTEKAQNAYIFADSPAVGTIKVNRPGSPRDEPGGSQLHHPEKAIWDLGVVTPDEPLSLDIHISNEANTQESGALNLYTYGLNIKSFGKGYNTLAQGAMRITRHGDTLIEGAVAAPEDGLLYTSIPYDKSWQVSIDGKRVPVSDYVAIGDWDVTQTSFLKSVMPRLHAAMAKRGWVEEEKLAPAGGLLGVPIKAGAHNVTLRYVPRGYLGGVTISGLAIVLLALFGLLTELLARRKEKKAAAGPAGSLFSTEGLSEGAFSLDIDDERDELPPLVMPPPEPPPVSREPSAEEPVQPSTPEAPRTVGGDAETAASLTEPTTNNINVMLQEMQARAEELRRKMQVDSDEKAKDAEDDEGSSFRLL
jgi:hypothetical protein